MSGVITMKCIASNKFFINVQGLRTLRSGYISQEQLEVADEKQLPSQCLVVDSKCDGIQSDNELISETHRGTPHEAVVHETHKSEGEFENQA